MLPRQLFWAIVLVVEFSSTLSANPAAVSVGSLLDELKDISRICRRPEPPYRLVERAGALSDEGAAAGERVLFESAGPGAIVRIWIAPWPTSAGTLRIYLNGQTSPVAELPSSEAPVAPPLVERQDRSLHWAHPIPYASGCRVTWETPNGEGPVHYQVSARAYPPGTPVESYSITTESALPPKPVKAGVDNQEQRALRIPISLSPEQPAFEIRPASRGNVITELRLTSSSVDPRVLRGAILTISFDGRATVRVPLGDFFGAGPGSVSLRSAAMSMTPDGEFTCLLPMPFLERTTISLEGPGDTPDDSPSTKKSKQRRPRLLSLFRRKDHPRDSREDSLVAVGSDLRIEGHLVVKPAPWDGGSLYFHAKWHAELDHPCDVPFAFTGANISGRGVYVGSVLEVANPSLDSWSLGTLRLMMDGQDRTNADSQGILQAFGTVAPPHSAFQQKWHGRARSDGPKHFGYSSYYRWRNLDRIPFDSDFKWEMEVAHASTQALLSMATVSYWYADPYHAVDAPRLAESQCLVPVLPEREIPRLPNAIEGEKLTSLRFDGEAPHEESMIHFEDQGPWSGDAHLTWRGGSPGNELVLGFEAPADRRYRVVAYLSKGPDFGIHRIQVNEESAGDPIDLFHPQSSRMGPVDLGVFELKRSGNRLCARVVSSARAASPKNCVFGLDCLQLIPVADSPP